MDKQQQTWEEANEVLGHGIVIGEHLARLNVADADNGRIRRKPNIRIARVIEVVRGLQLDRLLEWVVTARTKEEPTDSPRVISPILAKRGSLKAQDFIERQDVCKWLVLHFGREGCSTLHTYRTTAAADLPSK
jgi:hypothetical protein